MFYRGILAASLSIALAHAPASAADTTISSARADLRTVGSYLSAIAIKNGQVSTNHMYTQVLSGRAPAPSVGQALTSLHKLPQPSTIAHYEVVADPTLEELPFILPGATDGDGNPVPEPQPGLLFGTLDAAEEEITGLFDDLTAIDQTAGAIDTTAIDPTLTSPDLQVTDPTASNVLSDVISQPTMLTYSSNLLSENSEIALTDTSLLQIASADTSETALGSANPTVNQFSAMALHAPLVVCAASSLLSQDEGISLVAISGENACAVVDASEPVSSPTCILSGYVAKTEGNDIAALDQGMTFINADEDQEYSTPFGEIAVRAGTTAIAEMDVDGLKIRHCGGPTIEFASSSARVKLHPAEEVVISRNLVSYTRSVADGIAKRRTQQRLFNGEHIAVSEFSVIDFMAKNEMIIAMMKSSVLKERQVVNKILKLAAAAHVATRSHGKYRQFRDQQAGTGSL